MHRMGDTIKAIRLKEGLSVKELSNGICSPKYIYMIEKGERTPSISVLSNLNKKFTYDLFSIFPFSECEEPLYYAKVHEELTHLRRLHNIDALGDLLKSLPPIDTMPKEMKQFVMYNQAFLSFYGKKDLYKSAHIISKALTLTSRQPLLKTESYNRLTSSELYLYILLMTVEHMRHEKKDYPLVIEGLLNYILTSHTCHMDDSLYMISMAKITYLQNQNCYQESIEFIESITHLLLAHTKYGMHVIYHMKGRAYKALNNHDKSKISFDISKKLAPQNKDAYLTQLASEEKKDVTQKINGIQVDPQQLKTHSTGIKYCFITPETLLLQVTSATSEIVEAFSEKYLELLTLLDKSSPSFIILDMKDLEDSFEIDVFTLSRFGKKIAQSTLGEGAYIFKICNATFDPLKIKAFDQLMTNTQLPVKSRMQLETLDQAFNMIEILKKNIN